MSINLNYEMKVNSKNEIVKSQRNKENKEFSHIMSSVINENKTQILSYDLGDNQAALKIDPMYLPTHFNHCMT